MPVSAGYQTFVLDQLRRVFATVRARRMFGGVGLYADDLFFAVLDDDALYFKVDETTRPEFEARGMPPFRPIEGVATIQYFQVPEEVLEDPEALRRWAEQALAVARLKKKTKGRPTRRR